MPDRSGELRRRVLDAVRRGLPADQARLEIASLYDLQVADATWAEVWAESIARADADPAVRSPEDARAYLEGVRVAVEAHRWSRHEAGDRDRAVMVAILELLTERGYIRTDAGTRLIAERAGAGMTHHRVARAIGILEAEGWLSWEPPASRHHRRGGFATHAIKVHRARLFPAGCLFGRDNAHDNAHDNPATHRPELTETHRESRYGIRELERELPGSSAEPVAPAAGEDDAAQLRAIVAAWPPFLAGDLGPVLARVTPVGLIGGTLTLANHPGEPFDTEIVGRVRDGSAAILGALRAAGIHVADLGITYLGDARLEAGVAG